MAAITGYFDGSGSPDDSKVVAVGGLLSTPERWIDFEDKWKDCLDAHGVSALHMKDFTQSRREFTSWKDDEPKRRRFLNGLLWIIEEHVEYTAACGIPTEEYRAADEKYRLSEIMRPYTAASMTSAASILQWLDRPDVACNRDDAIYFFEKGDADQSDLRNFSRKVMRTLRSEPIFLNKIDAYPPGTERKRIRQFEAADLVAYENLKANVLIHEKGGTAFLDELRKPMQRMATLTGSSQWRVLYRDDLENICQQWKIPLRST